MKNAVFSFKKAPHNPQPPSSFEKSFESGVSDKFRLESLALKSRVSALKYKNAKLQKEKRKLGKIIKNLLKNKSGERLSGLQV